MASDSRRLQVIDRFVSVLRGITAGADYHLTPLDVFKGYKEAVQGYPAYAVRPGDSEDPVLHLDQLVEETFQVVVHGKVMDAGDVATPRERALQDVRKAVNNDFKPGAGTGSLIQLADALTLGGTVLDDGPEGTGFFGYFAQTFNIKILAGIGE